MGITKEFKIRSLDICDCNWGHARLLLRLEAEASVVGKFTAPRARKGDSELLREVPKGASKQGEIQGEQKEATSLNERLEKLLQSFKVQQLSLLCFTLHSSKFDDTKKLDKTSPLPRGAFYSIQSALSLSLSERVLDYNHKYQMTLFEILLYFWSAFRTLLFHIAKST